MTAEIFDIELNKFNERFKIQAEKIRGQIWVDGTRLAQIYRAHPPYNNRRGVTFFEFESYTVAVNPRTSAYSVQMKNKRRWRNETFERRPYFDQGQLMIPLSSVADFLARPFTYHWQKHALAEQKRDFSPNNDQKSVRLPYKVQNEKVWVSVKSLADALGVIVYSNRTDSYQLVMPDFSILEVRIGERWIFKKDVAFVRLDDPVLLMSGAPYISLDSVPLLFGINVQWNPESKEFQIPIRYGRHRDLPDLKRYQVTILGYKPEPFNLNIGEFSTYYQNLIPSYTAEHLKVYESVRDFLTNKPIPIDGDDADYVSGEAVADMKGNLWGTPLEGQGLFEKIGSNGRVVNANLSWGFPLFKIEGGRNYLIMNGFNNQFYVVDQINLSHSNDHFGENKVNPNFTFRANFGEHDFNVFQSTSLFSQTVEFEQQFGSTGFTSQWDLSHHKHFTIRWDHYLFSSDVKTISSVFNGQSFLEEILGEGFEITVDPSDQTALVNTILSDRHMTSILDLNYQIDNRLEFITLIGGSRYKNEITDENVYDYDALARTILKKGKSRLDLQYEQVGDDYRALGDPLRYQARKIVRVAPYLDFTKVWRVYGEARREDSRSLVPQGLVPYSAQYRSLVNLLNFKSNVIRLSANDFDNTLFGRRTSGTLDYTHFFGRNSLDLGATLAHQWDTRDVLFRRSPGGRVSFQFLHPNWKLSVGEEYTYHDYDSANKRHYESLSSILVEVGGFRTLLQYEIKPKYFLLEERLHTGFVRTGHRIGKRNSFNVFGAATSLRNNLSDPEVWRAGVELLADF